MNNSKGCYFDLNQSLVKDNANQNANGNAQFENVVKIIPTNTPRIIRKCARCQGNRFASSDKFRVNANKKVIDVWLIYKCISCDYTLNVAIFSRTSVSNIDKNLLERFHKNDASLAWQYAFDPSFIERGMNADWGIDFEVEALNLISVDNEDKKRLGKSEVLLRCDFFLKISISIILRRIFEKSRNQLEKMQVKGDIEIVSFQHKPMTLKNLLGFGCKVAIR